jgi:Uma2 family endonuclease
VWPAPFRLRRTLTGHPTLPAMAALPALIPRNTIRDLEAWEDRWELLEGIPHAMSPAPSIRHQQVSQRLTALVAGSWRIDDETVVIPDALVVCTARKLEGVFLTEAPALVVEILSPSTALNDRTVKRELYAQQGVHHYLLADLDTETVEGLELEGGVTAATQRGGGGVEAFDLGPCPLSLDFGALWRC